MMLHIYNSAYSSFYYRFQNEVNYNFLPIPENGWELLAVNLGQYPNLETFAMYGTTNDFDALPYIIIYNKFSGIIRLFAKPNDNWVVNNIWRSARVSMSFAGTNKSGLLRYVSGFDRALDKTTIADQYTALCEVNNQPNQWISADFHVAFDPCICNFPSEIRFEFDLVQNQDLVLHGGAISIEEEIVDGIQLNNGGFLSNFVGTFESSPDGGLTEVQNGSGGFVIYNNMQALIDSYALKMEQYQQALALVNDYNKQVDRRKAVLKYGAAALTVAISIATGGAATSVSGAIIDALGIEAPELVDSNGKVKHDKAMKEAEKYLAEAVQQFSSSDWKKKNLPQKPITPTATFTEMYFEGQIITSSNRPGPTLFTPGSYGSNNIWSAPITNPSEFPVYNEMLGVFALLESPKLEVYKNEEWETENIWQREITVLPSETTVTLNFDQITRKRYNQFKLKNDLKFAFNPKLDIKNYNIDAQIFVKSPVEFDYSFGIDTTLLDTVFSVVPANGLNFRTAPYFNVNTYSLVNNFGVNEKLNDSLEYYTLSTPLNAFKNSVFSAGDISYYLNEGLNSPLLTSTDISSISSEQYNWFLERFANNSLWEEVINNHTRTDKYYLKLIVNIEFNETDINGDPQEQVLYLTYEIDESDITILNDPIVEFLNGSSYHINQFPENLEFEDVVFVGQDVEGCEKVGNLYTCRAYNDIVLTGYIFTIPPMEVEFIAGNEIEVEPESQIDPEVILKIESPWQIHEMPEVDDNFVQTFCDNQNPVYQANRLAPSLQAFFDSIAQANPKPQPETEPLEFSIFPNPTNGSAQALVSLPEMATVSITLIDLTGKVIGVPTQNTVMAAGRNFQNLQTEGLSPGVYFVHLVVNGEKYVERLVKR